MSFTHNGKLLDEIAIPDGSTLDVVWKDTACSNRYGSPPAAFTWNDTSTGVTSAPVIGPCGHAPGAMRPGGPDDWACKVTFIPPSADCWWTYKKSSGSTSTTAKISNPQGATVGNLYLYKRTVLYAYMITPGKPTKKIAVPAGADTITVAPTS